MAEQALQPLTKSTLLERAFCLQKIGSKEFKGFKDVRGFKELRKFVYFEIFVFECPAEFVLLRVGDFCHSLGKAGCMHRFHVREDFT